MLNLTRLLSLNDPDHSDFGLRPFFGVRPLAALSRRPWLRRRLRRGERSGSGFGFSKGPSQPQLFASRLSLVLTLALLAFGSGCTKDFRKNRHLGRGERDFKAQQYDQAEIEYLNVLKVAPMNPIAIRQLGLIYQDEGKQLRAHAFLVKASELEPSNLEVRLKLALNSLALGDFKNAAAQAVFVLSKQPGQPDALEVLTGCAVTPKAMQDIQQQIDKMRQADQDRASYHVAYGTFDLRRQDSTNAEIEFKKALDLDPKSAAALLAFGGLYWGRGDLAGADRALKSAFDLSPVRSIKRLKYAEFKLMTGKTDEGKQLLQETTRQAPDFLPAWSLLAQLAFGEKKYDECNSLLQRILAREPSDYDASMLSGDIRLAKGDGTNAVAAFTRMSTTYARSPQVFLQLARAHLLLGDINKANVALTQAIALNPNFPDAVLLLANLNIRKGDADQAISSLTELIKRQPQIPQAHLLLADAYLAKKDPDQAVAVCRRMSELFPKAVEVPLLIGSLLERQNKLAEARESFEKALQLSPGYFPAIEQLVGLDISETKYTAAAERVQKLIDSNSKTSDPWLLMARVHVAQAQSFVDAGNQKNAGSARPRLRLADVPAAQPDVAQAEAALLKAIDLNPGSRSAYLMLADLYAASGKQQKALDRLDSLLSKTNDVAALLQVALLQDSLTNYPAARDAYEKLLSVNPNFSPALNNLAYLYSERFGELDKAYQMAEKARQLLPYDPATADTLGWILYRRSDFPRALSLLEESANKLPSEPEIQFHLGMTHYMLGEETPARLALQAATQSTKNFAGKEQAARRLALLSIDPKTADAAALSELQKELQDNPHDSIALSRLGAIQERDGALDKAADTYQAALKYNPQDADLTLKLASLYSPSRLNDPNKALALAKSAHDLAPDDARISSLLGRLVYQTGDQKWAASLLEDSARKLPGDLQVSFDLAWAYYSLGRLSDAQTLMQTAANAGPSFPKSVDAKRFLATVAAGSDSAQATQFATEAQKTLAKDPNYVPALMVSALAQEGQGNYQPAADLYNQVLTRFPLFSPATRNLGLVYFAHLGDDQKAYDLNTKARETFSQDPDVAKALGVLTYRKGNFSRAAQLLQESAQKRKTDAELLYYLGMAQYQLKAKPESKAALQQALAYNLPQKLADDAKRVLTELK